MNAYKNLIRNSSTFVFSLFIVFTIVMFFLSLFDNIFGLGWGFRWIDTVSSAGLALFAVVVILISRFILKKMNF